PTPLKTRLLLLAVVGLSASSAAAAGNTTSERCHPHDKRALLRIKQQSFNNSVIFSSWDPTTDCCNEWFFVRCDDTSNRVTSFIMLGADIEGAPFPTALGDLPYLEQIIFHNNATGPIPNSLSKLRRLIYLDLRYNLLSGPIPSFFATFSNLSTLDLSHNALTGPIPYTLPLAPSLQNLHLSDNRLTGSIPVTLGYLKNDKIDIDVSNNELSGEIPRSLGNVKLFSLDVSGNKLHGDASFLFGKDKTAWNMDLSRNDFSFDMTSLKFPHMMNIMILNQNRIYGSLPEGLAHLPQLNLFNVSYNRLCGRIPTGGTLGQFDETTYFHNKCLCGTPLPPCR
ncbi:hypothetical protein LNV47_24460, partial [Paucibacter sp. DJ4R-1]|nr:hypothetical protein [Paucibacter sp. DJ4R-1]